MKKRIRKSCNLIILLSLFCLFGNGCIDKSKQNTTRKNTLTGLGATFPFPFYSVVFEHYEKKTGNRIVENRKNSAAGFRALQDKTVDFIGSDAILSEKEYNEFKEPILIIPSCLGSIVLPFNIPNVTELNLTGPVIADIFMENIRYWDDKSIQNINPHADLPHIPITLVYRAEGSGTSYVFSSYLSEVSPEWKKRMGKGQALKWSSGIPAKGCLGVAGIVSKTQGAIGYAGAEQTSVFNINTAAILNARGKYVKSTKETVSASVEDFTYPDYPVLITNSKNENAYPLSCFSWLLVYKNQAYANRSEEKYEILKDFLLFVISDEMQNKAGKLNYVPLPKNIVKKAHEIIDSMEWKRNNKK